MSSLVVAGDTSGTVTLSAPSVAGSNTATLPLATGELSMLGTSGQTWTDVKASRVLGTTYTNSTGKPIQLMVQLINGAGAYTLTVNSVVIMTYTTASTEYPRFSYIIPTGATYSIASTVATVQSWTELR
jgi:hypothetical protein